MRAFRDHGGACRRLPHRDQDLQSPPASFSPVACRYRLAKEIGRGVNAPPRLCRKPRAPLLRRSLQHRGDFSRTSREGTRLAREPPSAARHGRGSSDRHRMLPGMPSGRRTSDACLLGTCPPEWLTRLVRTGARLGWSHSVLQDTDCANRRERILPADRHRLCIQERRRPDRSTQDGQSPAWPNSSSMASRRGPIVGRSASASLSSLRHFGPRRRRSSSASQSSNGRRSASAPISHSA